MRGREGRSWLEADVAGLLNNQPSGLLPWDNELLPSKPLSFWYCVSTAKHVLSAGVCVHTGMQMNTKMKGWEGQSSSLRASQAPFQNIEPLIETKWCACVTLRKNFPEGVLGPIYFYFIIFYLIPMYRVVPLYIQCVTESH